MRGRRLICVVPNGTAKDEQMLLSGRLLNGGLSDSGIGWKTINEIGACSEPWRRRNGCGRVRVDRYRESTKNLR